MMASTIRDGLSPDGFSSRVQPPIFTGEQLVSQLVGALSPINHRGLHEGCTYFTYLLETDRSMLQYIYHPLRLRSQLVVSFKAVLGPILSLIQTAQLGKVIKGYGVGRQLFADDNGLYDSFHLDQASADVAVRNTEDCCQEVKKWMSSNKLKLDMMRKQKPYGVDPKPSVARSLLTPCVQESQKSHSLPLFEIQA